MKIIAREREPSGELSKCQLLTRTFEWERCFSIRSWKIIAIYRFEISYSIASRLWRRFVLKTETNDQVLKNEKDKKKKKNATFSHQHSLNILRIISMDVTRNNSCKMLVKLRFAFKINENKWVDICLICECCVSYRSPFARKPFSSLYLFKHIS